MTPFPRSAANVPPEVQTMITLFNQKRYAECEPLARSLTEQYPEQGFCWKVLGAALQQQGRLAEAFAPARRAAELAPQDPEAQRNAGNILYELGRLADAEGFYRQAIALKPDFVEALHNLGNVLREQDKLEEAEAVCRRALQFRPDFPSAHRALVLALQEQGKVADARLALQYALQFAPDDARLRLLQLMMVLPVVPHSIEEAAAVPGEFDRALDSLSSWMALSPEHRSRFAEIVGLEQPFLLAYRNGTHVERLSRYGDLVAQGNDVLPTLPPGAPRQKTRLLIVSQHFRSHSVWHVILKGLLTHIDRTRFEIVLYHVGNTEDGETAVAKSLADLWRNTGDAGNLQGWLAAVAADRPDVIFYPEIGMDPMSLKLAARRLAPLQAASWGHPVTTGLPTIDLYFSGELLESPAADAHYRERLVRLPGTGCCTIPFETSPAAMPDLETELKSRNGPVFLIAQRPTKLDPGDDAIYARIASEVGECSFVLMSDPKYPWATEQAFDRLGREFASRGLDPQRHFLVLPWLARSEFHRLLELCDVYLDCPSFSGYTTARQAAHCGIPIVTLEGEFMRQRLAAGLLRRIGLPGTIASSGDDYVALAAKLAAESRNPAAREARRQEIRAAAPRMDGDVDVVRAFEQNLAKALAERKRT